MKVLYRCDVCGSEYPEEAQARTCEERGSTPVPPVGLVFRGPSALGHVGVLGTRIIKHRCVCLLATATNSRVENLTYDMDYFSVDPFHTHFWRVTEILARTGTKPLFLCEWNSHDERLAVDKAMLGGRIRLGMVTGDLHTALDNAPSAVSLYVRKAFFEMAQG